MVLALCGPSCIGKTYAKEAILRQRPEVKELRWYTTKPLDPSEPVGRYMPEDQFNRNCKAGKLVLVEEKDGHCYGYSTYDIVRNDVLFVAEISPHSIVDLREVNNNIKAISLVTDSRPNGLDILKDRMKKKFSEKEFEEKLSEAEKELEFARDNYNYFDAAVLVTKKNEPNLRKTVLSLANALI